MSNRRRRSKPTTAKRHPKPVAVQVALLSTGTMTPNEALQWLRDDARGYLSLVRDALPKRSIELSGAEQILGDLANAVEALSAAVASGRPLRLERSDPDPGLAARQIAQLITTEDVIDTGVGGRDRAVRALGRDLVGLLDAGAARDVARAAEVA